MGLAAFVFIEETIQINLLQNEAGDPIHVVMSLQLRTTTGNHKIYITQNINNIVLFAPQSSSSVMRYY